ncbi:MAG: acetylornithine/succinylornithine family transaminase [Melioribacteraceae bacterium]|nr:MAG: acetylornithine/succinylornithine family transaminase [Melioribacteraceae bacterium]
MIDYKELQSKYEFDVFPKRDVVLVKGKEATLWDDKGNEYIDCAAGIGVASIGHANPYLVKALTEQASTLVTCPGTFYNDTKAKFLEKLISIAPKNFTKAYLCNSGAEAMESAIKFTRYSTKKTDFIATMKGFHGRTLGALSATFKKEYREDFEPLVPGFSFVPFNNFEKLAEAVTEKTAGVIIEVIQGEGGINIADKNFLQSTQKLCNEKGIKLIIDEIQTGFCRTGKMFAHEHFDIQPDMVCLAKAIAGGFPVGAVLCNDLLEVPAGKHGTTYGGNPLACAAGLASINFMLDNKLDERAAELGEYFISKLDINNLSKIREVRHMGLMIGIELKEKSKPYLEELMKRGILALPAGTTVIRMLPPLVITKEQLDKVAENLNEILA